MDVLWIRKYAYVGIHYHLFIFVVIIYLFITAVITWGLLIYVLHVNNSIYCVHTSRKKVRTDMKSQNFESIV